MKMTRYKICKR